MVCVNPYLQCDISFSAFFVFFRRKVVAPNESILAQAICIHKQLLIAILPQQGERNGEDAKESDASVC